MSAKNDELRHDVDMFKKYKNLLRELTFKSVKLKYRNSWLGIFWSFLQPLLYMIVLSVVFGGLFGGNRKGIVCYPVYLFTGRLLFSFFVSSTKQSMRSFRVNQAIIKKVYVPKYMYPLSAIFSNFITFAISLICLVCVWIFFKTTGFQHGDQLHVNGFVVFSIIPMFILLIFTTGVGLILSVVAVYFRDVEYIWDVVCQLLFYMVPILYHPSKINSTWIIYVIKINPLYSMIELFRQCVLYHQIMSWRLILYATVVSVATLLIGIWFFNKKSDDIIFHL